MTELGQFSFLLSCLPTFLVKLKGHTIVQFIDFFKILAFWRYIVDIFSVGGLSFLCLSWFDNKWYDKLI